MKKIIMIDDDQAILDIFKIVFERAGYDITIFNSADMIFDNRFDEPDIFVIDKQLNGASGLEVCRYLKSRTIQTPVIIFSAGTQIDKDAKAVKADDFLEKPFKTKQLLLMVDKHINNMHTV